MALQKAENIWQQIERQIHPLQSTEKLDQRRLRALAQMETMRGTKIIYREDLPVLKPQTPIIQTPLFLKFVHEISRLRDREVAGVMQIDFRRTPSQTPAIYLLEATPTDIGQVDKVFQESDLGASAKPGQIEWHTHPEAVSEYGLNLDWQDLRNMVAGPRFIDPHKDIPDNGYRWITAAIAQYPDFRSTTALQLYMYELNEYDGSNPLSGLFALGPMIRLSPQR